MGISVCSVSQPAEMKTSRQSSAYRYASLSFAMDMIEKRPGLFFRHIASSFFIESDRRRGGRDFPAGSVDVWPQQTGAISRIVDRTSLHFTTAPACDALLCAFYPSQSCRGKSG